MMNDPVKVAAKQLVERSVQAALALGITPMECLGAVNDARHRCLPEFGMGFEPRPRPAEVIQDVCGCAEPMIVLLFAARGVRVPPVPEDIARPSLVQGTTDPIPET